MDHAAIITPDTYQNMGSKTFWYLFSKRSVTGFVFLIAALLLSVARSNFMTDPGIAGFLRITSWISLGIALVSFIITTLASRIIYKSVGFTLAPNALILRRGVFKKEEFAIPYRQIQNIEIERPLTSQMLGISKMIILTAGEEHEAEKSDAPENILPAIDREVAVALQAELLQRVNLQK